MARSLLLVGAGAMGRGYVMAARHLDLSVVLVESAARRADYQDLVDVLVETSGTSDEEWIGAALRAADQHPPDAVLAFSEGHVLAAAWVQDMLDLAGPSLRAAQISRNKALQRVLWEQAGVGQPRFFLARAVDPGLEWAEGRYPVVVKPLRGLGSAGVRQVAGPAELAEALRTRLPGDPVLVEEYIDAQEYSWEGLIQRGEVLFGNYTRKSTSGPPEFIELGHELPVRLTHDQQASLDRTMAAVVERTGVGSSLAHLEFRYDGKRIHIMELALRTPGDHIMDLLCRSYDHDFYASAIHLAFGDAVPLPGAPLRAAGVTWLTASAGTLHAVHGVSDLRERPGVVRVDISPTPGTAVGPTEANRDRIGHIAVVGATLQEVHEELAAVRSLLRIDLDSADERP